MKTEPMPGEVLLDAYKEMNLFDVCRDIVRSLENSSTTAEEDCKFVIEALVDAIKREEDKNENGTNAM